jgi:hypothetical protein
VVCLQLPALTIAHHVCSVALWLVWAAEEREAFRHSRVTPPWERNGLLNTQHSASRIPVPSCLPFCSHYKYRYCRVPVTFNY